jgi:putative ABC transport system permease protein
MTRLPSLLREFALDLRRQKLRSALTILGITWGTVAVVVLLACGLGLAAQMRKNARGIGDGVVILSGGTTTRAFAGFSEGRRIRLVKDDLALLRREVPGIGLMSPEYGRWTPVRRGANASNPFVTGVVPEYEDLRNVFPEPGGRFLNDADLEGRRRVAVLGDELKALLFGDAEAVGEVVYIGETPFTVVGVMKKKQQDSSYQSRDKDRIFIPATTFESVYGDRYVQRIIYSPKDPAQSPAVTRRIYEVLGRRYRFDALDRDALSVWDTNEMMKMFTYLFLGFNAFLAIVGSFTLVVGGIGVANIMYVVVKERTREIGVKRALGARRRDILGQVLVETTLVVGTGAALGLAISYALVALAGMLPIEEFVGVPEISPLVLGSTLALLALIAFLAGLFPARRAARLDPVEALRYGT